jgi:hypothetical protein
VYKRQGNYKEWLKNEKKYISSFELFELGDVEIILIESVNCNTKDELLKKEREYIEKYKDIIVNRLNPITTKEEKLQDKRQYYEDNKEIILEQMKQFRDNNKEIIHKRKKKYYEENKEEISQKHKQYREENKEVLKQKQKQICDCECGNKYTISNKARHDKGNTHQTYLNSLQT